VKLGTRGSALAMAQAGLVARAIEERTGEPVELVEIVTSGDRSSAPVAQLGVGVFVSALRDALLAKEIDVAVHSYKDLPTAPAEGLVIAAVPPREDPRDVLVGRTLAQLASGGRVGTGAVRRIAQLNALGLPIETVPIRGNVDTRLRKVAAGELDAVVLAAAGLARLGRIDEATELLDPAVLLPAPAQGALAVECRAEDRLFDVLSTVDDPVSRATVDAERALLATLEAGCSAPVAGLAEAAVERRLTGPAQVPAHDTREIHLRGAVLSPDGRVALRLDRTGTLADPTTLGRQLAEDLLRAGADTVLGVQR
jgi:hydroxymethylbilane synthase